MMTRILLLCCLLITINLPAQIIPTDGLVAHYPLDGDALDITVNENHGSLNNSPTPTEDRMGMANGALNFDGQGAFVNIGDDDVLDFTDEMSISVWLKPAFISDLNFTAIVNKWEDAGGGSGYYLGFNNNGFEIRWNTGVTFTDGTPIPLNEWTHLVVTYSASNLIIYRNGVEDISVAGNGPISPTSVQLRFGQQSQIFGNSQYYNGDMDQVLLYNRALTFDEVTQIYGEDPSSVTAQWNESNIEIFPNPFYDFFQIKSDAFPSRNLQGEIYDANGKLVQQSSINSFNQTVFTNNLEKGFYIFIIRNEEGIKKREKLLKI